MKNDFHRFISRLDMTEERLSELEDISVQYLKTKKRREHRLKNRISKGCETNYKVVTTYSYQRRRKRKRTRRNIWNKNDWESPPVDVRYQTTDPGSSEIKQNKCQKELYLGILSLDYRKRSKIILKILREARGANIRITSNYSTEMMQGRREWIEIFNVLTEKNLTNL